MPKYLFSNPPSSATRLFLFLGLVACLSWLALWCFRQPLPHGAVPADDRPRLAERYQRAGQEENGGQTEAPLRMAVPGESEKMS